MWLGWVLVNQRMPSFDSNICPDDYKLDEADARFGAGGNPAIGQKAAEESRW